jgi:hypothetical protein
MHDMTKNQTGIIRGTGWHPTLGTRHAAVMFRDGKHAVARERLRTILHNLRTYKIFLGRPYYIKDSLVGLEELDARPKR